MASAQRATAPRWPIVGAGLVAALASGLGEPPRAAAEGLSAPPAQAAAGAQFGLAHVDVMEHHVARTPEGPRRRSDVDAAALAARYRHAAATGARWHRWSAYWDLVESDGFDFAVTDGLVARDRAAGLASLVVLQGNAPGAGAGGLPPGAANGVFARADGSLTDDPAEAVRINTDNPWARFVAAVVDRYRPGGTLATAQGWPAGAGVRAWEIGNEPNLRHFWAGTPAEYVRLLEVAYLAIEFLDPAATVVHGGIADDAAAAAWHAAFLDALVARRAASPLPARYNAYSDRTVWHWYTVPSKLLAPPALARAQRRERGLPDVPLWVTEVGVPVWSEHPGPCWDPASPRRVSLAEQSAFVWQALAEGVAAGAELLVWFQLVDDCGNGPASFDAFGLVRNPQGAGCWSHPPGNPGCWNVEPAVAGTPRPAYDAFRHAVGALTGARPAGALSGPGWRGVALARGGQRVNVAWATGPGGASAVLPAAGARPRAIDESGAVSDAATGAGPDGVRVALPGATNRNGPGGAPMVDGRPVMVGGGAAAAGAAGAPAAAGATGSAAAAPAPAAGPPRAAIADAAPPYIAVVGVLPPESAPLLELRVAAGDADGRLGQYAVYYAQGAAPQRAEDWTPWVGPLAWPGAPALGEVTVPFFGFPGATYHFAATAADAAGNWTALPGRPQASTRIAGAVAAGPAPRPGAAGPAGAGAGAGPAPGTRTGAGRGTVRWE